MLPESWFGVSHYSSLKLEEQMLPLLRNVLPVPRVAAGIHSVEVTFVGLEQDAPNPPCILLPTLWQGDIIETFPWLCINWIVIFVCFLFRPAPLPSLGGSLHDGARDFRL